MVRLVTLDAHVDCGEVKVDERVAVVAPHVSLGLRLQVGIGEPLLHGVYYVVLVVLALGAR